MKLLLDYLNHFIPEIPKQAKELRDLFESLGLEIKRIDTSDWGTSLHLELPANRGDHHSYWGVAHELSTRLETSVSLLPQRPLSTTTPERFQIESDLCLAYSLTALEVENNQSSLTNTFQAPLLASGCQLVNLAVDISNLVNLEYGQPTHVFDADKIQGTITIRTSKPEEQAHLLFQSTPIALPEGMLIIADDQKVLAIAGVIGCETSKATHQSKRLLIESACFDPVAVRKSAKQLNLSTATSIRFERGSDYTMIQPAVERIIYLLQQHTTILYQSTMELAQATFSQEAIPFNLAKLNQFIGVDFSENEVLKILKQGGFTSASQLDQGLYHMEVPPHRYWDVKTPEDLYEEVCRGYNYDHLPVELPSNTIGASQPRHETVQEQTEHILFSHGFYEIFTDGFYSRKAREQLKIDKDHPLWNHVEIQNAVDKDCALLKNNGLVQALDLLKQNARRQFRDVKVFEWTNIFIPQDPSICQEIPILWSVVSGNATHTWHNQRPWDIWYFKGILEVILDQVGVAYEILVEKSQHRLTDMLHPYQQLTIMQNEQPMGILGKIHPRLCEGAALAPTNPFYLELETQILFQEPKTIRYRLPPGLQPIHRNLTFLLPDRVPAQSIQDCIDTFAIRHLESITVEDVYAMKKEGHSHRAVTFLLQFSNEHRPLASDINQTCDTIIAQVTDQLSSQGVVLRE